MTNRSKSGSTLWEAIRLYIGDDAWNAVLRRKKGSPRLIEKGWTEIRQRLLAGELRATGCYDGSLKPQSIEPEVWEQPFEPHTRFPVASEPSIVRSRWHSRTAITSLRIFGRLPTQRECAEPDCTAWLKQLAQEGKKPGTKQDIYTEALERFPGLSERGFKRIWRDHAPTDWKRPGKVRQTPAPGDPS